MICAWISLVAFVVFIERSLYSGMPILKLTPFRQRNFTFACVFNLVVGFGLFASTYLVPVFLGRVRDFNSLQIGTTVFVVGIAQLFSTIVAAKLAEKIDLRIILAAGLGLFSLSLWMTAQATSEWGFSEFLVPQLVRGFAIMLCIVPSVGTALSGFSGAELKYASGLFNVMRNLGGAIGIAVVNTWLQDNARISGARFGENLGAFPGTFSSTITELTGYVSSTTTDAQLALMQARGLLRDIISQQAFTLAFDDVFIMMSGMFLFALILVPFARTPGAGRSPSPGDGH